MSVLKKSGVSRLNRRTLIIKPPPPNVIRPNQSRNMTHMSQSTRTVASGDEQKMGSSLRDSIRSDVDATVVRGNNKKSINKHR
jgi:hypothetical protein